MAPFMHGIQAVNSSGGMFEGVDYGTGPNVLLRCRACESAASLIEDELKSHSTPHATPDRHRLQRSWIRGCRSWSGVDTTLQPGSARSGLIPERPQPNHRVELVATARAGCRELA